MDKSALKAKLDNYWYYYKIHTIVALLSVVVLVFLISDMAGRKTPILNVILTGNNINYENLSSLQDRATDKFAKGNKQEVALSFLTFDKNSQSQQTIAVSEKILAMIQAKELDILVMDRDSFDTYAKQGTFLRLDTINGAPKLNNGAVKFVMSRVNDHDDKDYPYGIDVSGNAMLKDAGYDTEGKVLGIVVNTQRLNLTLQFLKWILKL